MTTSYKLHSGLEYRRLQCMLESDVTCKEANVLRLALVPKPCVMVVEDDEDLRELLVEQIEEWFDVIVLSFTTAEDALNALRNCTPLWVITDVELGAGMNGLVFAEKLSVLRESLKVIIMSGQGDYRQEAECFGPFLKKPFSTKALANLIECEVCH